TEHPAGAKYLTVARPDMLPARQFCPIPQRRDNMSWKANLSALLAVTVGALGGWASASGEFDAILKAKQNASTGGGDPGLTCSPSACCADGDKLVGLAALNADTAQTAAQQPKDGKKPNILVIFGDDIGIPQISAYTQGLMGYRTPNIDRIAREGMLF